MIILCADDYALTEGISRAIGQLAAARRLSATSAMVTAPHWPAMAQRLFVHRAHLALGLHLNLTLGSPLGPMPRLAPKGKFLGLGGLARAIFKGLGKREIRAEIERQLDRFERILGFQPDHIDGHQHVHVLPIIRRALVETVVYRYPQRPPLIRNPSDSLGAMVRRQGPSQGISQGVPQGAPRAVPKAAVVRLLGVGFAPLARRCGLPINDSFAGFSDFDPNRHYAAELKSALLRPGRRHIVMCHPGHPDAELAEIDAVVARRGMEWEALMRDPSLPELIWRPERRNDGPAIMWPQLKG
jgi:predicted glycoside hydrolase/deacetylase ChbG (UPF0249 family)